MSSSGERKDWKVRSTEWFTLACVNDLKKSSARTKRTVYPVLMASQPKAWGQEALAHGFSMQT